MTTKRALVSVTDKTGIVDFCEALIAHGYEIVSTGGTASMLADAGLDVTEVESLTGFPEMLDGRLKTLHPMVHGGILGIIDNPVHVAQMSEHGIQPFDLVVVNLYDFAGNPSIEQIDIGGPTMVRGAAKNHTFVGVVTSPAQYQQVLDELIAYDKLLAATRYDFAVEAFAHTAEYDLAIVKWMSGGEYDGFIGKWVEELKYGENAWQSPAFIYQSPEADEDPLAFTKFVSVEGASRGLVGAVDEMRALQVLTHLAAGYSLNFDYVPQFMAVAVKHGNACGAAVGNSGVEAISKMIDSDPESVFGGVVMTSFAITSEVAEELKRRPGSMYDAVIGSEFQGKASEVLRRKGGKCRMSYNPALDELGIDSLDESTLWRQVRGGFIQQPNYTHVLNLDKSTLYGGKPTEQEEKDLLLAWAVGAMANSNSIAIANSNQLLALGAGQQSRIGGLRLALSKATQHGHTEQLENAVLYSDSFFPFDDVVTQAGESGIRVIFASARPNGDEASIMAAEKFGVTLLLQSDGEVRGFAQH